MFRNPHVAFCSVRPLLLGVRDPTHACCRCTAPGPGARAVNFFHKDRGGTDNGKVESSADKDTASRSANLATNPLKADSFLPAQHRLSSHPKPFVASQNLKTIGSRGCSKATKCLLQPCKRQPDPVISHQRHPSFSHVAPTKSQRYLALLQSNLSHRELFLRPFSSSSEPHRSPWSLNYHHHHLQSCGRPPPLQCTTTGLSIAQVRALLHHAAAPVAEASASLKDCLSQENEERCRQTLGPNRKLYETGDAKELQGRRNPSQKNQGRWKASVLVSLCSVEEQPAFLFTLRSNALKGRHKGDVSFAGGKSDQADKDVVETALREAQEELGITVDKQQVWGVLKPLRDMSGMLIAPVLANLGPLEALSFKPNPQEVEEIFTLSLSHVCDPRNRGYTHFRTGNKYGYTLPVFRHGKHRVWGLTAVALEHTLKIIVPP